VPIAIAVQIVHKVLTIYKPKNIKEVILVLHNDADHAVYIKKFQK
jgi:hypothetical protein